MTSETKVILVDDHLIVREGIRALLNDSEGIRVVGEAADRDELWQLLESTPADLVFMDISLPGTSGIDLTAQLAKKYPILKVIILSMHNSEDFIFNALKAGARGYLPKNTSRRELSEAIKEVMDGGEYFGEPVSSIILKSYMRMAREEVKDTSTENESLTGRETDILRLFAEGLSNKEIATQLCISVRTVESHKNHIMRKLGLKSVVDLVKFAIRTGIIDV